MGDLRGVAMSPKGVVREFWSPIVEIDGVEVPVRWAHHEVVNVVDGIAQIRTTLHAVGMLRGVTIEIEVESDR